MRSTAIRATLFLFLLAVVGCLYSQIASVHSSGATGLAIQGSVDAGKLFEKNCAKCHGKDGRAKTFRGKITGARNLTDEAWQAKISDEQIKEAIKKGPDEMPAFETKLSEVEINALVAYVRHFKGTAPKN